MKGRIIVNKIKILVKKYMQYQSVQIILIGILLNLVVECLSRRSFVGLLFPFANPILFVYNAFIICVTLSVALLVRRRVFVYSLVSVLWLTAGIVDFVVLAARKTPFTAMDLYLINDAIKIIPVYLNPVQIGLIIALSVLVIVGLVIWWFKAPKFKGNSSFVKNLARFGVIIAAVTITSNAFVTLDILAVHFGNLPNAYKEYGFAYCFSCSVINRGISKPDEYSSEYVAQLKSDIEDGQEDAVEDNPNVIFLQLESFMDPNLIKGVTFSENPVPYFEELMLNYSSGYLSVPCVGAGTANTEFEIQTGMNIDDFGPGEYPYRTIMQSTTCESTAYNLKKIGYAAHAIHNNDATFYDRNRVFENLGYDTFTSIEYMDVTEETLTGWAKDEILTSQILQTLDSTENEDYIFTISVQGHGDYPSTFPTDYKNSITAKDFFDLSSKEQFDYYISQLKEMDTFIKALTEELSKREEKTVLVMYGDHLPGFSFKEENLITKDLYQTEYVVWDNYDLPEEDIDLEAYQLSAHVLGDLGISEGIVTKFHQKQMGTTDYLKNLTVLEYDILYGKCDAYGGKNPFEPTVIQMGTQTISIVDTYNYKNYICIEGFNFNDYSVVYINGKEYTSEIINNRLLKINNYTLKNLDVIYVVQKGTDKIELSRSKAFTYKKFT